jgi:hypothetical protein
VPPIAGSFAWCYYYEIESQNMRMSMDAFIVFWCFLFGFFGGALIKCLADSTDGCVTIAGVYIGAVLGLLVGGLLFVYG